MDDEAWSTPQEPLAPRPEPLPERPRRRAWSTLTIVLVTLAGVLAVAGLVVIGFVLMLVVGMNQYASNK